jgi:uncharacterized membrane protein YbjE (DUF340 family)
MIFEIYISLIIVEHAINAAFSNVSMVRSLQDHCERSKEAHITILLFIIGILLRGLNVEGHVLKTKHSKHKTC